MNFRPTIDMTPDGRFRVTPVRLTWPMRLGIGAAIVAVAASAIAGAALFLWLASVLLPVALVAGLVAYLAFRLQVWRTRRAGARAVFRR